MLPQSITNIQSRWKREDISDFFLAHGKKNQMALAQYCWTMKVRHWKIFSIDTRIRNVCLLQHAFDPLVQSSSLYKLQNIFWQKGVWFVWFENKPLRFSVAMLPQSITTFTLVALLTLRPVWDDLDKIQKNRIFSQDIFPMPLQFLYFCGGRGPRGKSGYALTFQPS